MKTAWFNVRGAKRWLTVAFFTALTAANQVNADEAPGIAFVYLTNPGSSGWTYAHDQGVEEMQAHFGDKLKVTRVNDVPESADAERVFRDLANKGNRVIVGTSFGHQDFALKVARDYPDITFLNATGYKTAKNFGVFDIRQYQAAYLAGIAAAYVTRSHVLGVVASTPIPAVIRNIDAFTLGARSVNPEIRTNVIWVNSWFDPGKEKQAAETLIGQGADVLFQNTESTATLKAAAEKHVYAFGWNSDMKDFAPTAHLGSVVNHWGTYYQQLGQSVLDGHVKTDEVWLGIAQKGVDLEDLNTAVIPSAGVEAVNAKRAELEGGQWDVFNGPIKDQSGTIKVSANEKLSDLELHRLNWYVEGVQGTLPK